MKSIKLRLIAFSFLLTTLALPNIINADSLSLVSRTTLPYHSWGVTKKDSILYIPNRETISIVNVSNPYAPIYISEYDPFTRPLALFVVDTILYCRGTSAFVTMNISNIINPTLLHWRDILVTSDYPRGINVLNNRCYMAVGEGFIIYDVTNPAAPDSVGFYDTPGAVCDLVVRDTLAYTACTESLYIVNVKNPVNCYRVGATALPTTANGVTLQGNYAYVACGGYYNYDGRVVSVNISDPGNPVVLDILNIQGNPLTVSYVNGRIYNIAGDYFEKKKRTDGLQIGSKEKATIEGGLRVINVAKPDSIYYVTGYNTFADPRDAIVDDSGYVYIADQDSGLVILRHFMTGVEGEPSQEATPKDQKINIYPNPCKQSATIKYQLTKPGHVTINIYNINGQRINTLVNVQKNAGVYTVKWDCTANNGTRVPCGIYFCEVISPSMKNITKIVLIK